MNIVYNYEILNVNVDAKCMDILYTSDNRQPIHIGARLPYIHETLESIIEMYAPIRYWEEQELKLQKVPIGKKGTIDTSNIVVPDLAVEDTFDVYLRATIQSVLEEQKLASIS